MTKKAVSKPGSKAHTKQLQSQQRIAAHNAKRPNKGKISGAALKRT